MKKLVVLLGLVALNLSLAQGCEGGFRTVTHDLGTTCVPKNPQRVVTSNLDTLGLMLALGIEPAGHNHAFVADLAARTPGLRRTGERFNAGAVDVGAPMNPESVLQADPDLILVESSENPEQLSAVAPLVAWDVYAHLETSVEPDWAAPMMFWADVLNVTGEAERLRDEVNGRLASLAERAGEQTVSVVGINPGSGELLIGSPMYSYEQLARLAGLRRPAGQGMILDAHRTRYGTSQWGAVSLERLNEVDADRLILLTYRGTPEAQEATGAALADLGDDPLWRSLRAVRAGTVHEVNSLQWLSFDFASVNGVIDQLFEIVAGVDPAEVSPNPFLDGE